VEQVCQFWIAQAQTPPAVQRHAPHTLAVADFIHTDQIQGVGQGVNRLTEVNHDAHRDDLLVEERFLLL
jgi:hypothetical protein